jgi:hypothetical protein
VDADRLELDILPEDQALGEVVPLEIQEPPDDPSHGIPIDGRRDEARLGPLVLPGLHEVLHDDGGIPERGQGLHDAVDAQITREPDGSWRLSFDDRVGLGQVVAVPVLVWVVDQPDSLCGERLVESPVLGRRHHPAPVRRQDRLVLLGKPPDNRSHFIIPDQGVVIDEDIRQAQPLDGGDLGLERPVGS